MQGGRQRLAYGVVGSELEGFVEADEFVRDFLSKYGANRESRSRTWWAYASTLFMFFRWLRVVQGLSLNGRELLDEHIKHRNSVSVEGRRWAVRLALDFSRDNPDLSLCGDGRKYQMYNVVKQFFDFHEAPLTSNGNSYARKIKRKFHPRQISVDDARRLLGYFNVRDRAILLTMLQSGMSIGDCLNKFSLMLPQLTEAIRGVAKRFRIDFDERKGNDFQYFTFISTDALYELKKWLALREHWLDGKKDPGCIFIAKPIAKKGGESCREGRALSVLSFEVNFIRVVRKMRLKKGPWSVTPHMFRKLFKTESRAPERGIDSDCVEFMMGHSSGIQAVGGVYDKTPELHAEIVEKEYSKIEPFLNIFSGVQRTTVQSEEIATLKKQMATLEHVFELLVKEVNKEKQQPLFFSSS